jgi:predicted Zn-dependent protease
VPASEESVRDYTPKYQYAQPAIWSDASARQPPEERERVVRRMMDLAEAQGLQSAGSVEVSVSGTAFNTDRYPDLYSPSTRAECSLTVRDPKAAASGWAGASSYDWAKLNPDLLVARAIDKCVKMRNPVAVEPGRWTVIFEPQAVYDLVSTLIPSFDRWGAEMLDENPFHRPGTSDSKLTLRVADEKINMTHDLTDPDLGVVPFNFAGEPYASVKLIEHGILTGLGFGRDYAIDELHEEDGSCFSGAFRIDGGTATTEEMIDGTARGLLVTRLSGVYYDPLTVMATGVTRDGIWLIERGKVGKPAKNFRFVESPIFFLNKVEQLGQAVPIYTKGAPAVVPAIKARDFNMVALADAV